MSGDSQRNDDPDFLDDDFVVEDLAGKNDDLEQLFDDPRAPAKSEPNGVPDSDDMLFTDHTANLAPSEQFKAREAFDEKAPSGWQGEQLELDGDQPAGANGAEELTAAEAAFTEELGSLVQGDEELGLDSEKELELVDGPGKDGISELEQSGPFVLDDGDGAWQEAAEAVGQDEPVAADDDAEAVADEQADIVVGDGADAPAQPVEPEVAEAIWDAVKEPAMAAHATDEANEATEQPGWEPLPEASVDELSEVGEVATADEAEPVAALADHDGHDIYGADAPVLVGPRAGGKRGRFALFASIAASLALVGGAAVVVMRPEWVGLRVEAEPVQQVRVERPRIEVAVATPPVAKPPAKPTKPEPKPTPNPDPKATPKGSEPKTEPNPSTPDANPHPSDTTPALVYGPELPPDGPLALPTDPAQLPTAGSPLVDWPAPTPADPVASAPRGGKGKSLVRIGDDTMLGEIEPKPAKVQPIEGVLPGTRAFAQLRNGNYFIGSIKLADSEKVTLRVNEGEVTLPADDVVRVTALGSADYEALQKATSGFVRLTNSNKLVGGILSQIADDHIILEFRSNRVMLPKSAIGQVVQGEPQQDVRLDVTPQEEDWVKSLAERQIGAAARAVDNAPMQVTPLPKGEAPGKTAAPTAPKTPPAKSPPAAKPVKPATSGKK